ncbi:polymorphic outer membrane protein repeat (3 repeats) [Methanobrevibacter smithii DSM 2374]|uniref:Polymorphic outer membrane protein repeat (3 repeats) n=1 Tax=Methanobrevibacter smithii DSM 2374 TaxID=521002 RepID=D2ZN66_METSM|nr:Ig-like domain repeat protein [Methanobrevibacter smithii]EFC93884.1 polymorphic outer membrane protein repeat (3 repeats) [Methanobrevibacter smithii DSM 2374]
MDKKILIIFLIAIVAFSISCVSAADSNEIVMNSSDAIGISEDISVDDVVFANQISSEDSQVVGDSLSGEVWVATTGSDDNDGSQASPVASVSKAVDLAQSGSTIHIKEGTYNHGKISLNKTLSFVGEGKVILNSNGANVFACEKDGYNLEFTNLVFTGVSSTAGTSCGLKVGGNGNLKVINCTFTDISAKYGAMQLYTTGVADIINSTIKDVVSGTSNGCIVYISGSGTYNFNNLSIINPKLADSVVAGSPYAFLRNVFYSYGKEATVTLTNSIITGASGPIQAVVESRGKLTIYNTVISNNVVGKTTTSYGKYLLYVGEVTALNMTNCIIENNTFADSSSALIYFNSACKANITYSSIVDNGFSKNVDVKSGITPTVNLDYNWWGTNTYTGDNVNKWVVMSTPETTINAESGKAIDVSVNFNHYTDASGSIQDLAQSISGINVDFSAVSGTLSKNNVASVDGIATVTYTTTTNDKITAKSGSQSLTIDVTVSSGDDNVVTKETFFNFFDSEGNLLDSITYDTLIFKGEFSNLGINVITISKPLTINGNNAVLKNIGFAIVSGDVTLNGLTLAGNTLSEEIEGSVININDVENVMLSNLNIDYSSVSNDLDIALIKCVQSANVELVDSNIKYVGNKIEEGLTNYVIYVDTCPNMVIKGNTITASLYPHNINFGDIIDSAAIYVEAGVIGDSINLTNNTISIDVLASDIKKGAVYGLYSAYSESYLNDNTIVLTNKNEGYCKVYAVYSQPGVVSEFNNILINASSNGIADGIYGLRVTVENTNVTIVSNGPAVGINSISGKNVIKNSKINVTGLATNTDSVLGITFEKMGDLIGNSIYVHNMGKYSDDNLIYGIFSTKDTKSNIKNNEITSEGNYAIYLSRASDSNITDNILYAHELKGNDAVNVIGINNIIKDNKPITVTDVWVSASGSDANDGSQDSPVATIAKAIELVAEGYTIHVGEGTYIANSLTIAKSFAMIGSGKVIIDGNASKIMNINENTIVNFTNVAFTNALNNYGGVMQSKGTVNLNNVSIYKNTQKSGSTPTVSSIYNTGVMTIVNSNIYENDGYGLIFNSGNLDIINTSISSNNVAKGTTYAFLYIDGGAVNVINSTLSDNTARLGGIWLNKGTLNVNNATFENNVVTVGNGGAIHIESDSSTATIKDSKFIGNKANKDGGAIYNKGTLNIETSIFDANAASSGNTGYYGDDIYNSGILTLHYSALLGKGTNKLIYNEGREPSANAQYNWWGTNSNPSTLVGAGLDYDDEPCDDVDVSNWVVMSVDPTSIEKVIVGNEKTLTVNFNHYNANSVIKELAKSIPSINVNFEAVNGTLSSDVAATDNGVASVTYTVKGNDQITVKSGSQTLTVPVTTKELTNIVTNETFFDYFGDDGMLLGDITFDTLIFKGEFSNLGVNVVYVPRAIVINGDNAVLRNIAIMCEQGTTLNNLTLNATNYVADTDGALIYAIGSDVTVNNITIDYNATDGSNNAIAVYASGADNFKLVNSTITFTGNNVDGKVFAQGIKIAKSNNAVVDSNIITTSCPLVDVDYSHWGSIDTDLVFAIGVEKSENVKIINNIVDNSAWTKGNNANFPTFDAFIAHTANNLLIKNNTISHTDLITPKGTSSYIYALDFYESNSVIVEDNRVLLNTTGGKEGAGAAYAVQVTGPYNNFVVKGNNLTTVSNGPNLGVYSQNYYGATEITAENNWINVTGFAGPAEFALVSGMEFQDTVAKAYNNTIYVQNVNEYNDDNNIAGITYVQSTSGSHQFDIQNNTIYSEGKYAVLIKSAKDSQIIGNTLYAHELNGDDAAIFKSGTNNVVKNNYPMSTDIIIDVNNAWIGKEAVIGITLNSAATGTANIMVGGKTYTVNLTDGKATLKVSDLPAGENTVKVDYDGDGKFKSSTNSTTFKVFDGIVTNETFFDYFINGTLADYVPEGATLDFRGKFYSHDDVKFDLVINKPINMISTTGDAFIDLNTTAGSLLGENPGSCFTINNGGSGSNVSGIIFHNTQVWIYDAHNVVLNNISVIVENKRVGSGVGTTAIRHGSTNVTLKNSYIYTSNNGGSSSIVLTHVQNCTVENNTIVGEGNVGNLLYLNTFNDAGCDLSNDYNKIINNKITGPSPAAGICYGIGINGNNNLIAGNVINYAGNGIVPAWGATPNNNTYCDNVLIGGASMSVAASSIAYNNTVSGTLTIGSGSVAYNNTAKAISVSSNSVVSNSSATAALTVQAGAKVANVTAASLSVNGKNAVIENVSISGVGTIKSSATNTTLINSTFGGMLTVQSAKNTIKYNNIVLATGDAAILATGGDNVITNNYLIAGDKLGDNAVNSTVETNIVKDNLPGGIVNVTITAKDVFEGSDVIIDVTVDSLSNLTEKFMLKINNKEYVLSFTDSKANVTISDLTAGKYDIAVTYGDETYTLINATSDVSVYGNVVTNETFFIYFDEDGLLREEVPFDELIFKGEFSDIVNLISITTPLKITSDNAVLRNIAFAVLSDNVVLNGLTLISNVSCADNGGALILVAGNNVNVSNMNISYIIKGSVDAVAINANGVSNLNVVNSNIFFESCPKDDTLTACVINIDGVSNSFINGNNITAVLPYLFASNYDMKYFMMGVNTVNPIRMRECNNVTFSKNNVNTTANDGSASFPTLQCMFIVGSNDCVIDGNNFSMIDTLIPAGTSNYLYGINIGYNKNLMISNNDFKMSTAGGKDAAGTAYAIQGVECEVSMIGNNITSISNGPNLGIYFASMTGGTSELYIANNLINVTGLASASGSWALVSGIEVQNGNAKIYNNTIYTYNVGDYSPENYMYGISYAQYMYGDRSFDIRDNRIYVDGHYAVSFINVDGSNVTGNLLITRNLGGDAAVEIKAGKNNVVENNYPRSSDLIFNITSEEPGKILIDVTIDKKATGNIAVVVDGDKYDVAIVNGSAKLTLSDLPAGVYYIEAKYNGNSIVTESYNSTKFTIDLIDSSIAVEAKDIKCGEEAVITATVTNGATGTVTFFVNGKTYVVDITDSVATLKIADLTTGDYPVFAYYNGDKYYKTSYNSTTFNVAKLASTTTVNVSDIKVGEDAVISIAVPEITSGVVSVTVGDAIYNVAVVDGKGSLTLSGLASGSYDVVAKFNGDDKYLASEDSAKFNVTKLVSTIDIAVDNIKVGEDAVIGVALPEDATGEVIISVNGKNYTVMTKYGMANVTISDLANGTYSVDVFYNGDDIYAPIKNSTAFTVSKVSDYNMTVDIADIVKGENATITVSVPEDGTGSVIVTINGTDYKGTVVNGTAKVIIPGLDEGTYKVVTFYTGDNKYDSMIVNGTITVNKNTKTTLTMDNLVKYFNGPQKLMAKLVDGFGNPIANATVYFTINGKVYARITDENGTASIAIRLLPGEYKASALFNGTGDYDVTSVNASVLVKNTILGNDTTLYFRNGTQYVAKFLDSNGKALANTDVKFNINGVFYTRVTDENGIARLNIRLDPASYIITAYNPVTGEQKANNITVLPRIIAEDLSMKYLDGSTFNAALVDGQGKAISGVNITFNINGVFYHRTTDADGVTKLNIRLMPGEYIITSMYDECWASNKIIISA